MRVLKNLLTLWLFGVCAVSNSQEDLLSLVDENKTEGPRKVYATFKTVRICNAQTIETVKKQHLDFRISHRFGNIYDSNMPNPVNEMFQTYFGFDNATDIRFSLDYGVLDNLTVGIGRSRLNKLIDGSLKWKILQQTADFSVPVSIAYFNTVGYTHAPTSTMYSGVVKDFATNELHRFNFFHELIIACKFNDYLSLEVLPSVLHRNFIKENTNPSNDAKDVNTFFSVGFGGRVKITKRVSFIGDYYYTLAPFYQNNINFVNPLALGFEIETGGHVFSLFFTNASALVENNYLPYTTDSWSEGQVKFGFCISRTFAL